jgi:hypothetical protein
MKIQNNVTEVSKATTDVYESGQATSYPVEGISFDLSAEGPGPGPDKLPPRLRIRDPVSATRAPLSTLAFLLPLRPRVIVEPLSPKRRSKLCRRFTTSGRLNELTGEDDCSRRGEAYADGDPKDDESDGGGLVG